ncbi:MAG: hypothetical protein ACLSW7_06085, partial [Acutalibacteraceae bacterium]
MKEKFNSLSKKKKQIIGLAAGVIVATALLVGGMVACGSAASTESEPSASPSASASAKPSASPKADEKDKDKASP